MSGKALISYQNETLLKVIKFLETHNGRDKLVRLMQYGSRFLAWFLLQSQPENAKKLSVLENHSSLARKVFRLFKSLSYIQNAFKTLNEQKDAVLVFTTVIQGIALAAWLLYDHLIWAGKLGLTKVDLKGPARRANIFWLIAMVMGIIKSAHLIQRSEKLLKFNKNADVKALKKEQSEATLEMTRNILDLPIPLYGLSTTFQSQVPTGFVGLCGTITSLIGLKQVWNKL
eukprot:TRINITY_DN17631_c0_g1_i1.p1 TRINITY_DN17631_c0_g1~~TRINITY_DN17631_c0_g1_i1.p1  ORF type:complete len:229 (-),score=67.17 TRINITY_DN17631_c0_g1_i1:250-936(-)